MDPCREVLANARVRISGSHFMSGQGPNGGDKRRDPDAVPLFLELCVGRLALFAFRFHFVQLPTWFVVLPIGF